MTRVFHTSQETSFAALKMSFITLEQNIYSTFLKNKLVLSPPLNPVPDVKIVFDESKSGV